jgi:hypothetical protein
MADPKLEALIMQLEGMQVLLTSLTGLSEKDQREIEADIHRTIRGLRDGEKLAGTKKEKEEFLDRVEALAKGVPGMTRASIDLANAVKSGDAYAISASTLDLAASLVSTAGAVTGPIGAAAAAVLGAVLSAVSMILKLFVKVESPSLLAQIEEMIRNIESETRLQDLGTAREAIKSFTAQARNVKEDTKYSFQELQTMFNPTEGNTLKSILSAQQWLLEQNNQELALWGEVLAVHCQIYISYKLSLAHWLPHIKDTTGDNGTAKLVNAFVSNDDGVLEFLNRIKPAARNRGMIWRLGSGGACIYVRDVVRSNKKKPWRDLEGAGAGFAVANARAQASPHPYLAILLLSKEHVRYPVQYFEPNALTGYISPIDRDPRRWDFERFQKEFPRNSDIWAELDFALENRFTKKSRTEDMDGQWPLDRHSPWATLGDIGDIYDIWAIPGTDSPGEIYVYTADGEKIQGYVHNKGQGEHLAKSAWHIDAYKVVAVRVVTPKTFPGEDPKVLANVNLAVYGLCEVSARDYGRYSPFAIPAFFPTVKGNILPPSIFPNPPSPPGLVYYDWRNYPVGIAVDSIRLWVYGTSFIACATHTAVKQCIEKQESSLAWMTYPIPPEVGGYDPRKRVSMGLCDLSACDDGTLTAVFEDKDGIPRIITASTRFEPNQIIEEGQERDLRGNNVKTHGWVMDREAVAIRVQKQPIFCWPLIEGLENSLKPKKGSRLSGELIL